MKAVLCKDYGPPESLVVEEVESPTPTAGDVKIAVHACGVNFPDVLLIKNEYQFKPALPFSPGAEVAGEVMEVGPGVDKFKKGDRVIGMPGWDGFREEICVDQTKVVKLPDSMDYVTGAAVPMTYGTSYHALVDRAKLQPGEWLLVHGAAGGVGTATIDIGKILGAKIVATGGDDAKLAKLKELYGVEHVINYKTTNPFKDEVKSVTGGGADVIYDPVGGDVFEQSLRCIAWEGRLLVVGFASGTIPAAKANLLLLKGCAAMGVFWGRFAATEPKRSLENFEKVFEWHAEGKLKPHVSHRIPLEKASEALYALINREVVGKCVLTVDR